MSFNASMPSHIDRSDPIAHGVNGQAWLTERLQSLNEISYPAFVAQGCANADRIAIIFRDRRYSYRALFAAIAGVAQVLASRFGVTPGARVVLNMENSDHYVIAYLAVLTAGAVAVPINPKLTSREVAYILSDCGPVLYVCDPSGEELGASALASGASSSRLVRGDELCAMSPLQDATLPPLDSDAAAAIYYTSGTTGSPKGVVHTHRTLVAGGFQSARAWGYDAPGLTNLATTPLFHIAAHAWFFPVLANGGTLVIDTFKTERLFELIQKHGVNGVGAVPSMLLMMVRFDGRNAYDLGSVTNVRFGASPMPPDKLMDVQRLFPNASLYHGMGQTESGGTISVLHGSLAFEKVGGTGYPLPGCSVRIVDDQDRDVPGGTIGEVLAQGPNVMKGYFGREDATRATLAHGWLHTGDLGYRDSDGCIFLVDRKKDMIIRGGENIYSVEVENILSAHPDIAACAVVAIPDDLLGETVGAVVVLNCERRAGLHEEFKAFCETRMARFKVPARIEFVDELPQTATGKIQKVALRQLILERIQASSASDRVSR
jgi:long-chain acyl-CoA synthetase